MKALFLSFLHSPPSLFFRSLSPSLEGILEKARWRLITPLPFDLSSSIWKLFSPPKASQPCRPLLIPADGPDRAARDGQPRPRWLMFPIRASRRRTKAGSSTPAPRRPLTFSTRNETSSSASTTTHWPSTAASHDTAKTSSGSRRTTPATDMPVGSSSATTPARPPSSGTSSLARKSPDSSRTSRFAPLPGCGMGTLHSVSLSLKEICLRHCFEHSLHAITATDLLSILPNLMEIGRLTVLQEIRRATSSFSNLQLPSMSRAEPSSTRLRPWPPSQTAGHLQSGSYSCSSSTPSI